MLEPSYLIVLFLFAGVVWFWRDSLAARENAIAAARRTCQQVQVQMLDQTVSITGMSLTLSHRGLRLRRRYRFEFSTDGTDRFPGRAELLGQQVVSIQLDGPSGLVVS